MPDKTLSPQFIDVHSHLNFPDYDADREVVLARMKEVGAWTITVGVDYATSKSAVEFAEKSAQTGHEGIFACIGLHPLDNPAEVFDKVAYKKLAESPRVVAIGECGLDYSRFKDLSLNEKVDQKQIQREQFLAQIELASELGKPLMLHIRSDQYTVDAYDDAYDILKSFNNEHPGALVRGNVHFFAGDLVVARKFVELGFTLSFTGVITFARAYDEVIKFLPPNMILSETDCPFVAPAPNRGKRNEPAWVGYVVTKLAEIRGESPEDFGKQVVANARHVFGI